MDMLTCLKVFINTIFSWKFHISIIIINILFKGPPLTLNKFTPVAFVRRGPVLSLFVDGVKVSEYIIPYLNVCFIIII